VGFLVINLWEETAWEGFVQTRLERRHNFAAAAVLAGIPFALIHMPFQFIDEFTAGSVLAGMLGLLIFASVVRPMLGVFRRGTQDSVFAVGLMHAVFNRSNNTDGIVAMLVEGGRAQHRGADCDDRADAWCCGGLPPAVEQGVSAGVGCAGGGGSGGRRGGRECGRGGGGDGGEGGCWRVGVTILAISPRGGLASMGR
jgi:hypothetical protein